MQKKDFNRQKWLFKKIVKNFQKNKIKNKEIFRKNNPRPYKDKEIKVLIILSMFNIYKILAIKIISRRT